MVGVFGIAHENAPRQIQWPPPFLARVAAQTMDATSPKKQAMNSLRDYADWLAAKLITEYPSITFGEMLEKGMEAQREACNEKARSWCWGSVRNNVSDAILTAVPQIPLEPSESTQRALEQLERDDMPTFPDSEALLAYLKSEPTEKEAKRIQPVSNLPYDEPAEEEK